MNNVKIVHCADIHLDSAFTGIQDKAAIRKDELRETLNNIINITISEEAKILLISGDLFDSNNVSSETVAFIKSAFNKIPNVKIFISPGNHDPIHQDSCYLTEEWPENVCIFTGNIEHVDLEDLGVRVHGMGFTLPYLTNNALNNFSVNSLNDSNDYINIMVMHGDVVGTGASSDYNPISIDSISNSGLDYLALGHKHDYSTIHRAGNTFYAYPGDPEGRGFDETGDKGVIVGTVSKGYVDLSFRSTAKRKYYELDVDITDCKSHDEVCNLILRESNYEETAIQDVNPNLYKIILKGTPNVDFSPDISVLKSRLLDKFFFVKFKDKTSVKFNLDVLVKENTLRGVFARKMCKKIEIAKMNSDDVEVKKLEDALNIGLKAFDKEVEILDY